MAISATQDGPELIGEIVGERYKIEEVVGAGGMATVYKAFDQTLERPVAVKVMRREVVKEADQLERFRREARAAAKLSHAHIVTVIDAGEENSRPYIVFEYVPGETLKQRIKSKGSLPITESVAYAIEIGSALVAAHAAGLVHRDVKPQNVLLDPHGHAKVADFGIARELEASDGLTKTGRVLGTTDYVSPEQAMGEAVTGQSDVYSLGIVLYEMLTGDVPFKGENHVAVAMKHVKDQLPDIQVKRPEVSNALAAVLEKMTEKEPVDRYLTAASAVSDLEDVLAMESARAGGLTGEATIVFDALPKRSRRLAPSGVSHPTRTKVAWLVAALATVGIALLLVSQLESGSGGGGRSAKSASGTVIPFKSTGSFDPTATGGDGKEHDDESRNAIDGNPQTDWTTEQYQGGVFAKPGIGLWGRTYKAATAATATVRTPDASLTLEIYGARSLPTDLSGWTRLGDASGDVNGKRISLRKVPDLRYYMVWITALPPASGGSSQAHISEFIVRR
ncbi:MAG: serine/threonine protein kinase [Thermoleophilaceae bacterium]|nr:serine/threonine protein kinase [Thermoleophilaceae bacterium]